MVLHLRHSMGRGHLDELITGSSPLDRSLVRGVSASDVLDNFGDVLRDSQGCEETYALSQPVRRLDAFVSHSWRDSRLLTWLALCYHYNLAVALALSLAAGLAVLALEDGSAAYFLPPLPVFTSVDGVTYFHAVDPVIAGTAAFFLALALGGYCTSRSVFLDKCCIDQCDASRKLAGIQAIPEVLRRSRTLILVYERDYFERLWCVFELAMFAAHHTVPRGTRRSTAFAPGALEMLPVERSLASVLTFFFFGLVQQAMIYGTEVGRGGFRFGGPLQALLMTASMLIPCVSQLRYHDQKRKILRDLATFRLDDAKCADPRDREYVEQLIAERWEPRGGLAGFERDVREGPIFEAISRELGAREGFFRYEDQIVCMWGLLLMGLGMHAHNDHATSHAATTFLGVFVFLPAGFYVHALATGVFATSARLAPVRLPLTVLAFVACITAVSLVVFHLCRAPCRAFVGYGCLRA